MDGLYRGHGVAQYYEVFIGQCVQGAAGNAPLRCGILFDAAPPEMVGSAGPLEPWTNGIDIVFYRGPGYYIRLCIWAGAPDRRTYPRAWKSIFHHDFFTNSVVVLFPVFRLCAAGVPAGKMDSVYD